MAETTPSKTEYTVTLTHEQLQGLQAAACIQRGIRPENDYLSTGVATRHARSAGLDGGFKALLAAGLSGLDEVTENVTALGEAEPVSTQPRT